MRRFRLISLMVATALAGAACATTGDADVTASRALDRGPGDRGADTADVPGDQAEREVSYADIISMSVDDIQAFWRDEFHAVYGGDYEDLAGGVWAARPDSTDLPGCGEPDTSYDYVAGNAYYCPIGDFVMYDDAGLFPQIYETYGPWVIATVLAHEWGHAIQRRAGVNETSIIMEQQADCFAGAWTRWIDEGNSANGLTLPPDALNDAMSGFIEFKDPAGLVSAGEEGAHGSAFDRVERVPRRVQPRRHPVRDRTPTARRWSSSGPTSAPRTRPVAATRTTPFCWTQPSPASTGSGWTCTSTTVSTTHRCPVG